MLEIVLSCLAGVTAALLVIYRENGKLKRDKKIHDAEVEDARLETKQEQVKNDKAVLKKKLKELDNSQAPSLEDKEIENYWNKK